MNRTEISGTARTNSMKPMHSIRTTGMFDRRPSARQMPIGKEKTMPVTAMTMVSNRPPHFEVSTTSMPK